MRLLSSFSLTSRVAIAAFVAVIVPIAAAYLAVATVPERLARDAVSLDLQTVAQNLNTGIREHRLALRERIATQADTPTFQNAVIRRDAKTIGKLLKIDTIKFVPGIDNTPLGLPINGRAAVEDGKGRVTTIEAIETHDTSLLEQLRSEHIDSSLRIPVALVSDDHVVARTRDFPRKIDRDTIHRIRLAHRRETTVRIDGRDLPALSRRIGLDGYMQVVIVATPRLVDSHIDDRRSQLIAALISLAVAGLLFSLFAAVVINRSLRPVGRATERLAAGDFDARIPVHGSDAFAHIATSYNSLAERLRSTIGDMRATLESIEQGVCLWSAEGTIALWNRAAETMTGVSLEQLEAGHELRDTLRRQSEQGTRRLELPVQKDGAPLVVDMTVVPVLEETGVLQTFADVTAHEELERLRTNFVSTASHELRTPLTSILGYSDTLTNDAIALSHEQRRDFLELINREGKVLQRLIDDFFQSSQFFDDRRVHVDRARIGVRDAVLDGIDRGLAAAAENDVPVVPISTDLPAGLEAVANREALASIVAHVVDNALKYGEAPIQVEARSDNGQVDIVVSDAGTIDPQHLSLLFDPFYRVDPDMLQGVGGAGLGLFVSRRLATAMEGSLEIESAAAGTRVHIRCEA
jgi:PAS domain S-box-containing protein